jgi:hypothetical protein
MIFPPAHHPIIPLPFAENMTFKLKECLRMYEGPTLLANSTFKTLVMETLL